MSNVQSERHPMRVLAVDPGIRGCGVALFYGVPGAYMLHRATYCRNIFSHGNGPRESAAMALEVYEWVTRCGPLAVDILALEYPRVYPGPQQKGDQNDLLPLAGVVCAIAAHWYEAQVVRYFPRDWKGTVDPDVLIKRVQARLSAEEHKTVCLPGESFAHNVWDAIGLGLKAVGRFQPQRGDSHYGG